MSAYVPDSAGWDDVWRLELARPSPVTWFDEIRIRGYGAAVPPAKPEAAPGPEGIPTRP